MFIARTEKELICPKCGGQLIVEDVIDTDYVNNSYFEIGWCQCEKCHAIINVDIVYEFSHYKVDVE